MIEPKIVISDDIVRDVERFADAQVDTVVEHYKERYQFNIDKMTDDIIVGKLGEFAVYNYLKNSKHGCTKPDLKVYPKEEKRFKSDLIYGRWRMCVKSQSMEQSKVFGLSWTFQSGGNGVGHRDHILDGVVKWMFAGCLVDGNTVYIKTIIPMEIVLDEGVLKEPKMSIYYGVKKVLYHKDLEDMDIIMVCA